MPKDRLQETLLRLQRQDPLELGISHAVWHPRLLEERRYSSIFDLRPEAGLRDAVRQRLDSDSIVLKLYHVVQAPRRQREFDDLRRVQDVCGEAARHAVVRPVAVYADLGALLTARAPGQPGALLVRRACRAAAGRQVLQRASSLCAQAGLWLRRFQESQGCLEARSPHLATPGDFVDYVSLRLHTMQQAPFGIAADLERRTRQALESLLHADGEACRASVWSHSDFGPHNLLIDGSRLTVLDFELAPQHPWFDAAYFVETLAGFTGPLFRAQTVQRLQRDFLDAYGASGEEPLFLSLRLRHLVCTAASLRQRRTRWPFLHWPEHVLLRRRLQRLVVQMETTAPAGVAPSVQSA